MKIHLLIVFVISILFIRCEKEAQLLSKEYPQIKTRRATNVNEKGATFFADVLTVGTAPIIEYGFILRWEIVKSRYDRKGYAIRMRLKNEFPSDSFIYRSNVDIINDQTYTLTAYAITDQFEIRGEDMRFGGRGSMKPVINTFSPSSGSSGTIVTIYGNYFSHSTQFIQVELNDLLCEIVSVTVDSVVVKTPDLSGSGLYSFKVSNVSGEQISEQKFNFSAGSPK